MWAKTASYVSRRTFCLIVSELIFSLITIFGIWAQVFGLLVNLFCRVIEVPSFLSGRIFWEKRFAWWKILFLWIFLEPWRKIFRVLAYFVLQKEEAFLSRKNLWRETNIFRDWYLLLLFSIIDLKNLHFGKSGFVVKLLFYVSKRNFSKKKCAQKNLFLHKNFGTLIRNFSAFRW